MWGGQAKLLLFSGRIEQQGQNGDFSWQTRHGTAKYQRPLLAIVPRLDRKCSTGFIEPGNVGDTRCEMRPAMHEYWAAQNVMLVPDRDKTRNIVDERCAGRRGRQLPVDPRDLVVLAISVVVAALRA